MIKIKSFFKKVHWLLSSQIGFDPNVAFQSLRGLPEYLRDWFAFRRQFGGQMRLRPCLQDRYLEGGITKSEYFWQDLMVARAINVANPFKHVDIGSRVDGFVAHIASFRECEVFDMRPIKTKIPGIVFRQADFMNPESLPNSADESGYCDSVSCLHAIEHFGLGRYGDPINSLGYRDGIFNLSRLLKLGGTLYLSAPIGSERVEFNANWVFNPLTILNCAESAGMVLKNFYIVSPTTGLEELSIGSSRFKNLTFADYHLGLFIFKKDKVTMAGQIDIVN